MKWIYCAIENAVYFSFLLTLSKLVHFERPASALNQLNSNTKKVLTTHTRTLAMDVMSLTFRLCHFSRFFRHYHHDHHHLHRRRHHHRHPSQRNRNLSFVVFLIPFCSDHLSLHMLFSFLIFTLLISFLWLWLIFLCHPIDSGDRFESFNSKFNWNNMFAKRKTETKFNVNPTWE